MEQTGNVCVTGDDPEGANDGLTRRTAQWICTYAMLLGRLEMFSVLVLLLRPMHSHISTVQELLGHNDVATTQIYTHVIGQHYAGTVSPLDKLINPP